MSEEGIPGVIPWRVRTVPSWAEPRVWEVA
jgi:hypothetical protein